MTHELFVEIHFWTSNDHQETFNRKKDKHELRNAIEEEVSESGRISIRVLAESVLPKAILF